MRNSNLIILLILLTVNLSFSQVERIAAMGNPTISLRDFDLDFNLYDFGKNVAGLSEDRSFDVLFIRPSFFSSDNSYRRYFDYEKSKIYTLTFDGTKVLNEGTFRGYVTYEIENRINVNRALNRYPYTGIPFFLADTTSGDFVYNGPRVGFQYSFEFLRNFYLGFELNYQLVDGLKNIYSRAKSLWRNIDGSFNMAYYFDKNFVIGAKVSRLDNKESIEAKSEDLFDAEILNYRGDTYAFRRRSQSVEQTYREKSTTYSFQTIWSPFDKLKFGILSEYKNSNLKTHYPYGMLKEYEEGHSVFENIYFKTKVSYALFDNLLFGLLAEYENYSSWSRISELGLLIWKWKVNRINVGSGVSYRFNSLPLIAVAEIFSGNIASDSSKYIDNSFSNYSEPFYFFKTGFEFEIINRLFLRAGFQKGYLGFDPDRGGKDVNINIVSFGAGIYRFKSLEIDFYVDYLLTKNELHNSNKYFNSKINLKLYNY